MPVLCQHASKQRSPRGRSSNPCSTERGDRLAPIRAEPPVCLLNPVYDIRKGVPSELEPAASLCTIMRISHVRIAVLAVPRNQWVVERGICQKEEEFTFDPISRSICCPAPGYCCPNSVINCTSSAHAIVYDDGVRNEASSSRVAEDRVV